MLICQPPLKEMRVIANCCTRNVARTAAWEPVPLTSETGITVGQVLDAAAALSAEHRLCPWAWHTCHDKNGSVDVRPNFKGQVRVREGDMMLQSVKEYKAEEEARQAKIMRYASAKVSADHAGLPIPTLAEWEATAKDEEVAA